MNHVSYNEKPTIAANRKPATQESFFSDDDEDDTPIKPSSQP